MYNFNPYGQPVRPSYNLLFSHFKQLGYTDELAGAEANRIMMQTTAYNQYNPNTAQYNTNVNQFNTNSVQYNANTVNYNPNAVQYNVSNVQQGVKAPQNPTYDKSNLLSGVKISKPPTQVPLSPQGNNRNDSNNLIKIQLKSTPDSKSASKGFHDPVAKPQQPAPPVYPQFQQNMQFPTAYPQYPGFPMTSPPPPSNYPQPLVGNMYYPTVQYPGVVAKKPPNLSNAFFYDTKGKKESKKAKAPSTAPMTIDQVNKWIQDLYVHLNMTTCSKNLRKAVNTYIQYILEKFRYNINNATLFRSGTLNRDELKMLSADEIMNFGPPKAEPLKENKHDLESKSDLDSDLQGRKLAQNVVNKGKKKANKANKVEDVVESLKPNDKPKQLDISEIHKREQRSQRFKNKHSAPIYNFNLVKSKTIVGQSEELEKPYLRLTSEPNPLIVRPEKVLIKSFKYVFDKFYKNKNYVYVQEQFRSIRQDIQVQHLRSPFVVNVYTTNARLALLHSDLDQFNQCQTQLKHLLLYFHDYQSLQFEFELYYILYLSLQNMNMDLLRYLKENYGGSRISSSKVENSFRNSDYFNFANAVRISISDENFIQYFQLADTKNIDYEFYLDRIYKQAFGSDNSQDSGSLFYCKLLFKMFEDKFRMFSLYTLCRSSLSLSVQVLVTLLNFTDREDCLNFLKTHKIVFNDSGHVDSKQSLDVILESPLMRSKKI